MPKKNQIASARNTLMRLLGGATLATPDLARALEIEGPQAYRLCKKLEDEGVLTFTRGARAGLFCVDCDSAVTHANYQGCKDEGHDVRKFEIPVNNWRLTAAGIKRLKQLQLQTPPKAKR